MIPHQTLMDTYTICASMFKDMSAHYDPAVMQARRAQIDGGPSPNNASCRVYSVSEIGWISQWSLICQCFYTNALEIISIWSLKNLGCSFIKLESFLHSSHSNSTDV